MNRQKIIDKLNEEYYTSRYYLMFSDDFVIVSGSRFMNMYHICNGMLAYSGRIERLHCLVDLGVCGYVNAQSMCCESCNAFAPKGFSMYFKLIKLDI